MTAAVPTILADILDVQHGWWQLFSEPGAGSENAGLHPRSEREGGEWVIRGQKVGTSGRWSGDGVPVVGSGPDRPDHRGPTDVVSPVHRPGVEARPLRGGDAIRDVHGGRRLVDTARMVERTGIGGSFRGRRAVMGGSGAGHARVRQGLARLHSRVAVTGRPTLSPAPSIHGRPRAAHRRAGVTP